jgi:hypothetical protein
MGEKQRSLLHLRTLSMVIVASLVLVITATVLGPSTSVSAMTDQEKTALADRYSPVFHYVAGEQCFPVDVEYYLSQCNLNRSDGGNITPISSSPSAQFLGNYTDPSEGYYLDNRFGTNYDDRIVNKYASEASSLGYTVYSHVTVSNGSIVLQYWVFYVFYHGTYASHEGNWETIQITFSSAMEPQEVILSQHNGGYRVGWGDTERSGDHPNVFVAKDSHANYIRYWEGQLGIQQDVVNNNGRVIGNDSYHLVMLGDQGAGNHPSSQDWIDFAGRWGDWGKGISEYASQGGTQGPVYLESGSEFSSSFWAVGLPRQDMNLVQAQLGLYYYNLLYLVIVLVPALWITFKTYRRYQRKQLRKPYLHMIDFKGDKIERIANVLVLAGLVIGLVSAFFPYYYAQVNGSSGTLHTNGYEDIVSIDGIHGAQIYALDPDLGRVQLSSIPIPFGMFIAAGIVIFVMKLIGEEEKKVGKEYLGKGFSLITPLIITIIVIMFLPQIMPDLNTAPGRAATDVVIDNVTHSPLGGEMRSLTAYGSFDVRWGIGLGGLLMIVAATLMALAGWLMILLGQKCIPKTAPLGPASFTEQTKQDGGPAPMDDRKDLSP